MHFAMLSASITPFYSRINLSSIVFLFGTACIDRGVGPDMTLGDSEWLECLLYVTVLRFAILPSVIFFLLIYCKVCLRSGTARDPHRSAGSEFRIVIHRIFGIGETLHRQNVNKYRQNIVLVLRSISTDSKHCLIDICVKFCFAPICLEL